MSVLEEWSGAADAMEAAGIPPDRGVLLVGTAKEWFKSALEAVLEPEGFTILWARDGGEVRRAVEDESPDLVLLDESLPSTEAPALCRSLLAGPLPPSVPLVLYSSDMTTEHLQAQALDAGVWEVFREPVRAEFLVSAIRRLLGISRLVRDFRRDQPAAWETGLLTRSGLLELVPMVSALADREGAPLSCAAVGPTERASGDEADRQREVTARLCSRYVRRADLCGWIDEGDVAIVAYGTTPEDAAVMARRLDALSAELGEEGPSGFSAGIVSFAPGTGGGDRGHNGGGEQATDEGDRPAADSVLEAAHAALGDARRKGGGIQTVEAAGTGEDVDAE